jgi:hypothetical protein
MQINDWIGFFNGRIKSSGFGDEKTSLSGVNHLFKPCAEMTFAFKK